jgi:hypothetical protein
MLAAPHATRAGRREPTTIETDRLGDRAGGSKSGPSAATSHIAPVAGSAR